MKDPKMIVKYKYPPKWLIAEWIKLATKYKGKEWTQCFKIIELKVLLLILTITTHHSKERYFLGKISRIDLRATGGVWATITQLYIIKIGTWIHQ